MQKNINFTEGRIIPKLILFSIPILLSELLQGLYTSVDSLVVGKFVSSAALAAVSVCGPITNLMIGFFNGMSVGNTVMVARAYGSGDDEQTRSATLSPSRSLWACSFPCWASCWLPCCCV